MSNHRSQIMTAVTVLAITCLGVLAFAWPLISQNGTGADLDQDPAVSQAPADVLENTATLGSLLRTSLIPTDQVLYVWGGGWNEEDTGGNEQTNSIGLSPVWKEFYDASREGYDAAAHAYEIHNGLDCSGYVGWTLYNTLPLKRDYVSLSQSYGEFLSSLGYGTAKPPEQVTEILPGDIMYTSDGHVYIALGQYDDGSILLMHSSPPGVRLSGTAGKACEKALEYQTSGWDPLVGEEYKAYSQFRFFEDVLPDPDGLKTMTPDQVVEFLMTPAP